MQNYFAGKIFQTVTLNWDKELFLAYAKLSTEKLLISNLICVMA